MQHWDGEKWLGPDKETLREWCEKSRRSPMTTNIRECEERLIEAARKWADVTWKNEHALPCPFPKHDMDLLNSVIALDAARSEAKGSEPVPEEGSALYATIREIAREEIVRLEKRVEEIAARNAIACDAIEDLERDVAALESASTKAHHTCKHGTFIGPTCEKCSKATPTTAPHAAGSAIPETEDRFKGQDNPRNPAASTQSGSSAPSTAPAQSSAQGELVRAPKWSSTLICECGRRHDIHESFCRAAESAAREETIREVLDLALMQDPHECSSCDLSDEERARIAALATRLNHIRQAIRAMLSPRGDGKGEG